MMHNNDDDMSHTDLLILTHTIHHPLQHHTYNHYHTLSSYIYRYKEKATSIIVALALSGEHPQISTAQVSARLLKFIDMTDGRIDGWVDGLIDEYIVEWLDGLMSRWMDKCIDRWIGWVGR